MFLWCQSTSTQNLCAYLTTVSSLIAYSKYCAYQKFYFCIILDNKHLLLIWWGHDRITDTQWRHRSKKSENLGRCGKQNMLWSYLKIGEWEWIFGCTVLKAISSLGVCSPWLWLSRIGKKPIRYSNWLIPKNQHWYVCKNIQWKFDVCSVL